MHLIFMVSLLCVLNSSILEEIKEIQEKNLGRKLSESELQNLKEELENVNGMDSGGLTPFIIRDGELVASPDDRYSSIVEKKYVEKVISRLPFLMWNSITRIYIPGDSKWYTDLVDEVFMNGPLRRINLVDLYKSKKMALDDLIMNVVKKVVNELGEFGRKVVSKAKIEAEKITGESVEEEIKRKILNEVMKYGSDLCTAGKKEQIVKAQEIVCKGCRHLWSDPERKIRFVIGVSLRNLAFKTENQSENIEEFLPHCINNELIIEIENDKYGKKIVAELIYQVFLENRSITKEYANNVAKEVAKRERQKEKREEEEVKRIEEEKLRIQEELIKEEEREQAKKTLEQNVIAKNRPGKKEKSQSKSKVPREKNENAQEAERKERNQHEIQEKKGSGKKSTRDTKVFDLKKNDIAYHYMIHPRVLRWTKKAEAIHKILQKGSEENWKNRTIEEIIEQKEVHDIIEVAKILKDRRADEFFINTGVYVKNNSKTWKKIVIATLERRGVKEPGIVEVGVFKNRQGVNVIYHLMFRSIYSQKIEDIISSALKESDNVVDKTKDSDESVDLSGFQYPKPVRCEIVEENGRIRITWGDINNTAIKVRELTIFRKPSRL
ncbi:DUF1609 domain-containing protein [Encephalitozoon hellem]|uniref:DUF1609 domain-containing protein n=1 Tax=Encephalitozoon hellem TaxID=27973 RepID=A0ABY8CLA6_ENCHE|nr:DUF1609 domain-containing protein [Encephalitozoon hellem]